MLNNPGSPLSLAKAANITQTRRALGVGLGVVFVVLAANSAWQHIFNPPHSRLLETPVGGNTYYYQRGNPTEGEIQAGKYALKHWKYAGRSERHRFADALVQSGVLIGMTQKEIIAYMGPPDGLLCLTDIGPDIGQTGYYCADGESQCDLIIDLKNKRKANVAWLDVNW